jgi:hypothetical protein
MGMEVATAILVSAAIGAGTSYMASEKQKKAADEAARRQQIAEDEAKQRDTALRMNVDASKGSTVKYGAKTTNVGDTMTTNDLLFKPTTPSTSTLGGTSRTGLGF